jgi:hypothetical protein
MIPVDPCPCAVHPALLLAADRRAYCLARRSLYMLT